MRGKFSHFPWLCAEWTWPVAKLSRYLDRHLMCNVESAPRLLPENLTLISLLFESYRKLIFKKEHS